MRKEKQKEQFARKEKNGARKILAGCAVLAAILLSACEKSLPPELVVKNYFDTVARGDILETEPYLTPDACELIRIIQSDPEQLAMLEQQRELQKKMWEGIERSVSAPRVDGRRAEVDFTAGVPGKGSASYTVVLFLTDGQWKISCLSLSGPSAMLFQQRILSWKAPLELPGQVPASPEEKKD